MRIFIPVKITSLISLLLCFTIFSPAFATQCASYSYSRKSQSLWIFFGHLKGNFAYDSRSLADQLLYGLRIDIADPAGAGPTMTYPGKGIPFDRLPRLSNDRYFDYGTRNPGYGPMAEAAIIIGCTGKVYSAALFLTNGLSIFVRNKDELPLALKTFQNWAQPLWDEGVWEPQTGPHFPTKIFLLKGYGDQSVN